MVERDFIDFDCNAAGDRAINLCNAPVRFSHHGWSTRVGMLTNPYVQRQSSQELDIVILAHLLPASNTKNMFLVPTLGTDVSTHVFNNTKYRNPDLLEHPKTLARVKQGDILGGW